eukprot:3789716-Prymnesium_polylepis.1
MPKAAKVTHPPRRSLNCESDPPLKTLLPPPRVWLRASRCALRPRAVVALWVCARTWLGPRSSSG